MAIAISAKVALSRCLFEDSATCETVYVDDYATYQVVYFDDSATCEIVSLQFSFLQMHVVDLTWVPLSVTWGWNVVFSSYLYFSYDQVVRTDIILETGMTIISGTNLFWST